MSRSWRKHPVLKDGGNSHKQAKVFVNRRVRRTVEDLPSKGNHARRYLDDWMFESVSMKTKHDAVRAWEQEECEHARWTPLHDRYKTLEKWLAAWRVMYLRK